MLVDESELVETVSGPMTDSLVWATWALFVGLGLMLAGAGVFATLIAVRTELDGFRPVEIGLVSGAYFLGFLVGSRLTLRFLIAVGHIRSYSALASLLSVSILTAAYVTSPLAWILLRLLAGACLAGQYVVAESWLNQIVSSQRRGRLLSIYTTLTVFAFGAGQFGFTRFDPREVTGFVVAALLISAAVVPVSLSVDAAPPIIAAPEHMSLRELWALVPTGVVTSFLVGLAQGGFAGLSAVYATRAGLSSTATGLFVAMPALGSLLISVPVTAASDGRDRRIVGSLAAIAAAGGAVVLSLAAFDSWVAFGAMAVIGGMSYPLYSIAGAYTNDWVPTSKLTAVAGQLVLLYGAGAFLGPLLASTMMTEEGIVGYPRAIAVTHLTVAVYLIVRIAQHRPADRAKPWNAVPVAGRFLLLPPTVVSMGRRLRPSRRRARP